MMYTNLFCIPSATKTSVLASTEWKSFSETARIYTLNNNNIPLLAIAQNSYIFVDYCWHMVADEVHSNMVMLMLE